MITIIPSQPPLVGLRDRQETTMRYEKGHKETTRARIVEAASRRFRDEGFASVGVAALMADLGLTQGGFYNHFASKDELASEAVTDAARRGRATLLENAGTGSKQDLAHLVDAYLDPAHRAQRDAGCVAAALAGDVARGPKDMRKAFTAELRAMLAEVEARLPKRGSAAARRERALAIYAGMVGALLLSRAVDDVALSDAFLAAGRRGARTIAS